MSAKKERFLPTKFLWVDLEMTGLVADFDVILEVAAIITDTDFKKLDSYEACVKHDRELVTARMNENTWWQDFPENRDHFLNGLEKSKALQDVERELIAIIERHFGTEPAMLAGNSIHSDRAFIKHWMPELERKLHYRMLDVTSWKSVMETKYGLRYEKPETHRAYEDILASIAELEYYVTWFEKRTQ